MPQHEVAKRLNLTRQTIGLMTKKAKEHTGQSDDLPTLMDAIAGQLRKAYTPVAVKPKRGRPRKNPLPGSEASLPAEKAVKEDYDHRISDAVNHQISSHGQESGGGDDGIDPTI
jgi:hypothetical protein